MRSKLVEDVLQKEMHHRIFLMRNCRKNAKKYIQHKSTWFGPDYWGHKDCLTNGIKHIQAAKEIKRFLTWLHATWEGDQQ